MTMELFPGWQVVNQHPRLPSYWRRLLWDNAGRQCMALLTLCAGQSRFIIQIQEENFPQLCVLSVGSEGIHSESQLFEWAEWQIRAYEALQPPRKRAPKRKLKKAA